MAGSREYNPLDYESLTISVVEELMRRDPHPLPPQSTFAGAGVYAIFYHGGFAPYRDYSSNESTLPIYVGKAIPTGARKGSTLGARAPGQPLLNRLRKHAGSIAAAENLSTSDFSCRYLVVTPIWITMAERFLIENFQPIWNVCLDGFGNNDPGRMRYRGEISWWDALHPGRPWARKLEQTRSAEECVTRLAAFGRMQKERPMEALRQARRAADEAAASEVSPE